MVGTGGYASAPACAFALLKGVAVAVQEQWRWFGVASEVAAIIQDRAFDSLDAPVERVSGAEVPGPYARNLELMAFPSEKQVENAARRVMYEEEK